MKKKSYKANKRGTLDSLKKKFLIIMEEPLDILCINCQEMVSYTKIPSHSFLCVNPLISSIEEQPPLWALNLRLTKLKSSLEDIIFVITRPDGLSYKFLLKKSLQLLRANEISTETIEEVNGIAMAVKKFAKSMIRPGLIIYSERLRELASEKTLILIEELVSNGCNEEIVRLLNKKYSEILKIGTDAAGRQDTHRSLRKLSENLQNIDEIASQISHVLTQRSSTTSIINQETEELEDFNIEDIDNMNKERITELNKKSVEDMHKFFYSKCLTIKLSYSSRHPSQYIQIHELYKKVRDLEVPMEKWEDFIRDEFSHPEKWVRQELISRN